MHLFKAAKVFDGAETLVEEGSVLRACGSDATLVEKARRVPCLAPGHAEKGGSSLKLETFDVEASSPSTQAGIHAVVERLQGQLDAWKKDPNRKATQAISKAQKKPRAAQVPVQEFGHLEPIVDTAHHQILPFTPPTHKHAWKDIDRLASGDNAERESKDVTQKRKIAQDEDKCCGAAEYQTERDAKDTTQKDRAAGKSVSRLEAAKDEAEHDVEDTTQNKKSIKNNAYRLEVAADQAEHSAKAPAPTLNAPLDPSTRDPDPDPRRGVSLGPSITAPKPAQRSQSHKGGHGEQKLSLLSVALQSSGGRMKDAAQRPRAAPAAAPELQANAAPNPCPEARALEPTCHPDTARSKLKIPHIEYQYDEEGMVVGSELLDKVVEVYMRLKPDWGIEDTPPPHSWKQMVSKLFVPTRIWEAEAAERQRMWKLQWQTQIVMMDQSNRNVLAFEACKEIYKDNVREEEELCQYKAEHEARLRHIIFVEAPKFWEQLGL